MLSVIVPVYNAEKYIEECVHSLINQTYSDIEILLINDGSSDESEKKCFELSQIDPRIIVKSKKNGGPLSAKRLGIETSSGEYITFIDADDWIEKDTYKTMMCSMIDYEVDFVAAGIIRYYSKLRKVYDYNSIDAGYYSGTDYKFRILNHAMCDGGFGCIGIDPSMTVKIFKKNTLYPLIKKADEEYGHLYGEDAVVVYPYIMQSKSCVILDKCMYYHRQYENSSSRYITDDKHERELYEMYSYLKQFITEDNSEVYIRQLNHYFMYMLHRYNEMQLCQQLGITKVKDYLFPYNLVEKGSRIVLYGAGNVGNVFWAQLHKTQYCSEVIWVDKRAGMNEFVRPVKKYDNIDYYVIAVEKKNIADEIKSNLVYLGIPDNQIIWDDPILRMW